MNWKLSKIVRNNTYMVDGVNIFDLEWKKDGQVELKDVAHAMRRPFDVCSVDVNGKESNSPSARSAGTSSVSTLPPRRVP